MLQRAAQRLVLPQGVLQAACYSSKAPQDYSLVMKNTDKELSNHIPTPEKEIGLCAGVPLETFTRKVGAVSTCVVGVLGEHAVCLGSVQCASWTNQSKRGVATRQFRSSSAGLRTACITAAETRVAVCVGTAWPISKARICQQVEGHCAGQSGAAGSMGLVELRPVNGHQEVLGAGGIEQSAALTATVTLVVQVLGCGQCHQSLHVAHAVR